MACDFEEKHVNIFDDYDAYEALALCVSEEIRLNKGVSMLFKQHFGGVPHLQAQKKSVGHIVHQVKDRKHIFYLVSKQRVCSRPSYADLELCFVELLKLCAKFNVKTLAIPGELGEGLEILEDKCVKEILIKTFGAWDGKVIMYKHD
ncbi:ADP-ribose glycohydrolase oard1 [Umbelopsis nana]